MAAGIAKINGKDAMAGNIQNGLWWHKAGTQLDGQKTGEEILEAATLDWDVYKQPLFTSIVGGTGFVDVPYKVATVRSIDSHVLGVVGPGYTVIQNQELADFANALLKVEGGVKFESAGALFDGRIVWMLAAVPDKAFHVDGDNGDIMPYLVLRTGHDGLTSFTAAPTPVRVVCANTLNMAMAGAKAHYTIRHTVNALDRVEAARKALSVNLDYLDTLKLVSAELVKRPMTIKDVIAATVKLIPSMAESPEKAVKSQGQRDAIVALYQNSANLVGVPDSAYRYLQAVAQYADHDRDYRATKKGSADDARAAAILGGTALGIKDRALRLVLPAAVKRGAGGKFVKA
jgi:phage/plasmid-like protein (TIGR03299 family)